ncbi:MAG TPA: efflux RND transporter permease subunit [Spirochaetia bacterium]|nr:efflux RND transporter permease subunit [Spirochaetia bacterium]
MNLTELSVKRPTAILMGVLLIVGLGVVGYLNLGADLFPAVNTPIISITSSYTGAGAEEIDREVIKPIEDAVSGINGIDTIRSTSGTGFGYTILQFTMSTEMNAAVIDVQKAVDGIAGNLPKDATRPVIQKFDLNSQPFLIVSVTGTGTPEELSTLADRIRDDLESLPGVGNVTVLGSQKKQLQVVLDRTALQYYGVNPATLLAVVRAQNLNMPAGDLKQKARDLSVRLVGEFGGVDDVRNLLVPTGYGGSVRLSELADVKLDYPDPTVSTRLNGHPTIGIFVRKQSDANVVTTATGVKRELAALGPTLPPGSAVTIASDSTLFINSSLDETRLNLLESIITTSLVLFLFLRSWRSSVIVLVAIPVSLVGTFFAMWAFHFTLNIVSLMGLGLCIGILVDDSIVVLENIHRHIGLGHAPREAAVSGRREIAMAAIAITLCDVVVFAPIAFMSDIVGQFFREFGLTVVSATLLSLLVSFTVTPMMASRMLRPRTQAAPEADTPRQGAFGRFFDTTVRDGYRRFLVWSLDHRPLVIVPVAVLVLASIALIPLKVVGTEFMPTADQNKLIVDLDLGAGAGYTQTDAKVRVVEQHLLSVPEVETEFATVGSSTTPSTAEIIVRLKDKARRRASEAQVARDLRAWGRDLPGVLFSVTEPGIISRTSIEGTKPLIVNVTGPDRDVLKALAGRLEDVVRSVPGTADVDNTMRAAQTEVGVHVDRLAASSYGLSSADIALVLRTALAGTNAGVYRHAGDDYDMVVSYRQDQLRVPQDLAALRMTNPAGQQISLAQVASFNTTDAARSILRRDRQNVATISANTAGRPLGALTADIKDRMAGVRIPQGYAVSYTGDQANMASSFSSLSWALAASLVLVFMILVVLYESFLTPLIRMLSIPCGIIGALGALAVTGKAIGIISFIGLIMLDGLISKNGTLLIDYTHTLMKQGKPLREALVEAGITRLRPILMTSVTMIVGMMPLALSLGASSEIRSGMAVVLIGGLVTSTVLTPILLPVVYTMIEELRGRHRRPAPEGGYER